MCRLSWFLDPGGWSKIAAVRLYFIFPGICTLSLIKSELNAPVKRNPCMPQETLSCSLDGSPHLAQVEDEVDIRTWDLIFHTEKEGQTANVSYSGSAVNEVNYPVSEALNYDAFVMFSCGTVTTSTGELNKQSVLIKITTGELNKQSVLIKITTGELKKLSVLIKITTGELNKQSVLIKITTGELNKQSVLIKITTGELNKQSVLIKISTGELNKQSVLIKITTGGEKTPTPISVLPYIAPLTLGRLVNLLYLGIIVSLHGSDAKSVGDTS
ncbi:hypothetical protein STEG23_019737 [Scotinomys teguina]